MMPTDKPLTQSIGTMLYRLRQSRHILRYFCYRTGYKCLDYDKTRSLRIDVNYLEGERRRLGVTVPLLLTDIVARPCDNTTSPCGQQLTIKCAFKTE